MATWNFTVVAIPTAAEAELAVGKVFAALPPILAVNAIEPLSAPLSQRSGLRRDRPICSGLYRPVPQSGNSHLVGVSHCKERRAFLGG